MHQDTSHHLNPELPISYQPFKQDYSEPSLNRPHFAWWLAWIFLVSAFVIFPYTAHAADGCESSHAPGLGRVLSFDTPVAKGIPQGWEGSPLDTISLDDKVVYTGKPAVRIERNANSPLKFSNLGSCVRADFTGKTIELRGYLRTDNVDGGFAGLWLREDGDQGPLAIDNMQRRDLHGTTGWTEYSVTLPVKLLARRLVFGALLVGNGTVWVSNLQLLVDGKPIGEAPLHALIKTVLDTDHQFNDGSNIVIKKLTRTQTDNLVTLGKVWGFLKYYDPAVTSGHWQWDYELSRILPAVLTAPDRNAANAAILRWIKGLGPVPKCNPCTHADITNLELRPNLGWINNERLLGKALSTELRWIRTNRQGGEQFYVSLTPNVENPIFEHELAYPEIKFPDSGFQLLALYRFWNIIEYWYPDRQGMGENWDRVLAAFIPRLALAKDFNSYQLQMMALIAMVHDTHANLWSSLDAQPPVGRCYLPAQLRFVQNQALVTGYPNGVQESTSPLKIGDIVTQLDGKPVSTLVKNWSPYYGASNNAALLREIARVMTRGACGETTIGVRRGDETLNVKVQRVPIVGSLTLTPQGLPSPAFRLLTPEIAYLNLPIANPNKFTSYIESSKGTKGLIIDVRNYPRSNIGLDFASHLIDRPTPFVRVTTADLDDPGAFQWASPLVLTPAKPRYSGKIVILVDAMTQSYAEFLSMTLRAAPEAVVVGSTTAGADGNVSKVPLPGGLYTFISGIGVFYPDGQPTQRVGIVPNIVVTPTIAGIRAGRDQVLEEAVHLILGPHVPESEIQKISCPSRDN